MAIYKLIVYSLALVGIPAFASNNDPTSKSDCAGEFTSEQQLNFNAPNLDETIISKLARFLEISAQPSEPLPLRRLYSVPLELEATVLSRLNAPLVVKSLIEMYERCEGTKCNLILYTLASLGAKLHDPSFLALSQSSVALTEIFKFIAKAMRRNATEAFTGELKKNGSWQIKFTELQRFWDLVWALKKIDATRARNEVVKIGLEVLDQMATNDELKTGYILSRYDHAVAYLAIGARSEGIILPEMLGALLKVNSRINMNDQAAIGLRVHIVEVELMLNKPSSLAATIEKQLQEMQGVLMLKEDIDRIVFDYGPVLAELGNIVVPVDLAEAVLKIIQKWVADIKALSLDSYSNPQSYVNLNEVELSFADFVETLKTCKFPNKDDLVAALKKALTLPYMNSSAGYDIYKPSKSSRILDIIEAWN